MQQWEILLYSYDWGEILFNWFVINYLSVFCVSFVTDIKVLSMVYIMLQFRVLYKLKEGQLYKYPHILLNVYVNILPTQQDICEVTSNPTPTSCRDHQSC